MSQNWTSLYMPLTDSSAAANALRSLLAEQGYQSYDPFPGGTGTPPGQKETVRLFVAPVQDDWVRVLGQVDQALLPDLSRVLKTPVLHAWLDEEDGGMALYRDGERHDHPASFASYLRHETSVEKLQQAFAGKLKVSPVEPGGEPPVMVVGADSLPPELQQFAADQGVDPKKADKMAKRLTDQLFGRLSKQSGASREEQEQARSVLMGGGRDIWNSLHGQRLRAIAEQLKLPANWRLPTLETVRDSYQVHRLRQAKPRMPLIPPDQELLKAVPNALDYLPVYMGK